MPKKSKKKSSSKSSKKSAKKPAVKRAVTPAVREAVHKAVDAVLDAKGAAKLTMSVNDEADVVVDGAAPTATLSSTAAAVVNGLTDREREVLNLRFGKPPRFDDARFESVRANLSSHFAARVSGEALAGFPAEGKPRAVFHTDASGLWQAYLSGFPEDQRQHYNCNACRRFIEAYGDLVIIDEVGNTVPALWSATAPEPFQRMREIVKNARVTGVFVAPTMHLNKTHTLSLGTPRTGEWQHLAVGVPVSLANKSPLLTHTQVAAEKAEDFKNVWRALREFKIEHLRLALSILKNDQLDNAERVVGPVQWLHDLKVAVDGAEALTWRRDNIVWRAIASAPAGFCHPRSSMAGTLLGDLADGLSADAVTERWRAKMHPLKYQRPQAAPTAGNIEQAEKIFEKMGLAKSLERRLARLDEIQSIWTREEVLSRLAAAKPAASLTPGVFVHLRAKGEAPATVQGFNKPVVVTFRKFREEVLPAAERILLTVPQRGGFMLYTTAADTDAPPILQWDSVEHRNPVALYVWHGGSHATQHGLVPGNTVDVLAVTLRPNMWRDESQFSHIGNSVMFVLKGATETRFDAGNALFPSDLKAELHSVRSVVEAYSKTAELGKPLDVPLAVGLAMCSKGDRYGARSEPFRVVSKGVETTYIIDRWA